MWCGAGRLRAPRAGRAVIDHHLGPDLDAWLARNREALIRRWLAVVVERSTLEELRARPLGDWIGELTARLEGASTRCRSRAPGTGRAPPSEPEATDPADARGGLEAALDRELAAHRRFGRPFAVALLQAPPGAGSGDAPAPEDWSVGLHEAAHGEGKAVLAAGPGAAVVLLPRTGRLGGRAAADRLRVAVWRRLGERGALADVGVAVYPDDGESGAEIVAAALERLRRSRDAPTGPPTGA